MSNLTRSTPTADSAATTITAVPSASEGLDLSTLKRGSTVTAPRYGYFGVKGAAGSVTLAADTEIYVKRDSLWVASGVFRGGKAIIVSQTVAAEDFLQAVGDAERITLHCPTAAGQVVLYYGHYEETPL